jgi:hypothetical protein
MCSAWRSREVGAVLCLHEDSGEGVNFVLELEFASGPGSFLPVLELFFKILVAVVLLLVRFEVFEFGVEVTEVVNL